ncbi:MAG: hypothetical protein ACRCVT_08300 [Leadbetterella sp.]
MKKIFILFFFTISLFLFSSCEPRDNVSSACYKNDPIEELPWLKKLVEDFDKQKTSSYVLSLVEYEDKAYFVFGIPYTSSPMSYIFNCEGKSIGQLGINYDTFNKQSRNIKILKRKDL